MVRISSIENTASDQDKGPIVGIDLGTTNSLVAIYENGGPRIIPDEAGDTLLPSVIHWEDRSENPDIGKTARGYQVVDPHHTVKSVKRYMGRGKKDLEGTLAPVIDPALSTDQNIVVRLGEKVFSPIELSSLILKNLKNRAEKALGVPVTRAVITVPAYFNDGQRSATRMAGRLAGLDVVRILNEPTAAALAFGLEKKKQGLIVVYDLGGGTFDVSLLKLRDGVFEVLSTHGDTALGGDDFDLNLAKALEEKLRKQKNTLPQGPAWQALLLEKAEQIKKALSEREEIEESIEQGSFRQKILVTRTEFENLLKDHVERTLRIIEKTLADTKILQEMVDDVIMVGGSTRIPYVREQVSAFFKKDVNTSVHPEEVVALGAAIQAHVLSGQSQDVLLLDVVPLSLGIETYGGSTGKIIHRNTKIPAMAQETFTTYVDGQKNVLIHVLQGERELAKDCRSLAKFNLNGLPPMPAGLPKVQVTFLVDSNGILTVRARELQTQTETLVEVQPSYGLTDEEVEKMIQASFENAEDDFVARQLIETRVEAESILKSAEKLIKEGKALGLSIDKKVIERMTEIRNLVKGSDHMAIRHALDELEVEAKPLAEQVMNEAVQARLKEKKLGNVLKGDSDGT